MTILRRGMSLALVTLMTLSPLTALAQGNAAAETSSGAGQAPQTTVTAPDVTQPTAVEESTTTVEDTAPVSLDTETLPQLAPEEATPVTTDDADLETQLVSTDGQFRYIQYDLDNKTYIIITQYLGQERDILVPASLDGKIVAQVDGFPTKDIKSITISEGITKLGAYSNYSFSNYNTLETLNLPSTLEVTALSFANCPSLTSIYAPSVTQLNLDFINLSVIKNIPNLSSLTLYNISDLTNLDSLKPLLVNLTDLTLSNMNNLKDISGLKNLTNLTKLSLKNIDNVSDFSVFNSLVNLESLIIDNVSNLTNLSNLSSCKK